MFLIAQLCYKDICLTSRTGTIKIKTQSETSCKMPSGFYLLAKDYYYLHYSSIYVVDTTTYECVFEFVIELLKQIEIRK